MNELYYPHTFAGFLDDDWVRQRSLSSVTAYRAVHDGDSATLSGKLEHELDLHDDKHAVLSLRGLSEILLSELIFGQELLSFESWPLSVPTWWDAISMPKRYPLAPMLKTGYIKFLKRNENSLTQIFEDQILRGFDVFPRIREQMQREQPRLLKHIAAMEKYCTFIKCREAEPSEVSTFDATMSGWINTEGEIFAKSVGIPYEGLKDFAVYWRDLPRGGEVIGTNRKRWKYALANYEAKDLFRDGKVIISLLNVANYMFMRAVADDQVPDGIEVSVMHPAIHCSVPQPDRPAQFRKPVSRPKLTMDTFSKIEDYGDFVEEFQDDKMQEAKEAFRKQLDYLSHPDSTETEVSEYQEAWKRYHKLICEAAGYSYQESGMELTALVKKELVSIADATLKDTVRNKALHPHGLIDVAHAAMYAGLTLVGTVLSKIGDKNTRIKVCSAFHPAPPIFSGEIFQEPYYWSNMRDISRSVIR